MPLSGSAIFAALREFGGEPWSSTAPMAPMLRQHVEAAGTIPMN